MILCTSDFHYSQVVWTLIDTEKIVTAYFFNQRKIYIYISLLSWLKDFQRKVMRNYTSHVFAMPIFEFISCVWGRVEGLYFASFTTSISLILKQGRKKQNFYRFHNSKVKSWKFSVPKQKRTVLSCYIHKAYDLYSVHDHSRAIIHVVTIVSYNVTGHHWSKYGNLVAIFSPIIQTRENISKTVYI